MELTINIEDKKVYDSFVQFFKTLGVNIVSLYPEKRTLKKQAGFSDLQRKIKKKDDSVDITSFSEKALAEDWDSTDDERWDKVL